MKPKITPLETISERWCVQFGKLDSFICRVYAYTNKYYYNNEADAKWAADYYRVIKGKQTRVIKITTQT